MTYAVAFFSLLLASQALAGEVSDNYSKHYQDYYKEAKKAGFEAGAVSKLSTQHLGSVQKNTSAVVTRRFNAAAKSAYKDGNAAAKKQNQAGAKTSAAATTTPVAAKPKARSGNGPGTGDMSAGASKGAEKVQFGKPQN